MRREGVIRSVAVAPGDGRQQAVGEAVAQADAEFVGREILQASCAAILVEAAADLAEIDVAIGGIELKPAPIS